MYKRILIPLDGSHFAERALHEAKHLVGEGTELTLFQVISLPIPMITPEMSTHVAAVDVTEMEKEALGYLQTLADGLAAEGVSCKVDVVENDNVAEGIVEYATEHDVELIVQSTHGRGGITRLVFGSVAEAVLRHSPCPVLLVRCEDEGYPD